jgi:dTDP-glucose pyrophosphorylase
MKGLILSGGHGTRLGILVNFTTDSVGKSPLYKPFIFLLFMI